jgi:hypothetical protein
MAKTHSSSQDQTVRALNQKRAQESLKAMDVGAAAGMSAAQDGRPGVQQQAASNPDQEQRQAAQQSVTSTAELARLMTKLVQEQTQHGMQVATALSRTTSWAEIVGIQHDFVRASMQRMSQLNGPYLAIVRSMVSPFTVTGGTWKA